MPELDAGRIRNLALTVTGAVCVVILLVVIGGGGGRSSPAPPAGPPPATVFAHDVLSRDWPGVVELEAQNDNACDVYANQEPRAPIGSFGACRATLERENAALRQLLHDLRRKRFKGAGGDTVTAFAANVHEYLAATTRTYDDLARGRRAAFRRDEFFPWPAVCVEPLNDMAGASPRRFPEMPYNGC